MFAAPTIAAGFAAAGFAGALLAGASPPAVPEPPEPAVAEPDPATKAEASARFAEGRAHFEAGRFAAALAAFQAADALVPHDNVRFNAAQCLAELGRAHEAAAQFEALFASPQLSEAERQLARESHAAATARFATLRFEGAAGRAVTVDGTAACTVPCVSSVDPGTHSVSIDGEPSREVSASAGEVVAVEVAAPATAQTAPRLVPAPHGAASPTPAARPRPSALTWVGAPLGLLGVVGVAAFGARAQTLHGRYEDTPTVQTRQRGLRARTLANVSIGVAALGGALVVADLIRLAVLKRRR